MKGRTRATIRIGHGAIATEALLLATLEELDRESRAEPGLLAAPVRLVVPSRSLREHLGARLVRHFGRSLAGVSVQTLHGLALEILQLAGEAPPRGDSLFEIRARRRAREQPQLERRLGRLEDGFAAVASSVRDLLDAGFEQAHAPAVEDLLESAKLPRTERELAGEIFACAGQLAAEISAGELGSAGSATARAAERLRDGAAPGFRARAVLLHGFADATGVATELLRTLLARFGGTAFLDQPPDPIASGPVAPESKQPERVFTQRLIEGLAQVADVAEPTALPTATGSPTFLRAPGREAELREVAGRIRALLDGGALPEDIGLVARDPMPYRDAVRIHFRRLGIPFSASGTRGPLDGAGRRRLALLELLRRGEGASVDRLLDSFLCAGSGAPRPGFDLRVALRTLGAARVADLDRVDPAPLLGKDGRLPLPVRHGLESSEGQDGERISASRRSVDGTELRSLLERARAVLRRLRGWPADAPVEEHLAWLRGLVEEDLGWGATGDAGLPPELDGRMLDELAGTGTLEPQEFRLALERMLHRLCAPALGGEGGGVQFLGAMEARGRTFEHLFLVGLNRNVFPRVVRADPLLSDNLRATLAPLLPDIPIKIRGFDEERHLFGQLLSASPKRTLSWLATDDEGKAAVSSPLVDRFLPQDWKGLVVTVPPIYPTKADDAFLFEGDAERSPLRPASEQAVLHGLHGGRDADFGAVLELALAAGGTEPDPVQLAAARIAVLAEFDPRGAARQELGPYFGFLGSTVATAELADPRREALYLTTVENTASCAWQAFLRRLLRIEPTADPLESLPDVSPLLIGNTVHDVLEFVCGEPRKGEARQLAAALREVPRAVKWPAPRELERQLQRSAGRVLREEGIGLPGFESALAEAARPFLERAGAAWRADGCEAGGVLGAELDGALEVPGPAAATRQLRFRVDRVDRRGDAVWLTDYKTGKPISTKKQAKTRWNHLRDRIARGSHLQVAGYVRSLAGEPARGRYLFLAADIPDGMETAVLDEDEGELLGAFDRAVAATLRAWDEGSFFPRLIDPKNGDEPRQCEYCDVAQACLRGDSGSRRRLREWIEGRVDREAEGTAVEVALHGLWKLWEPEAEA